MATKVASLYAEIGADTSGLKKGLKEAQTGLKDTATKADGFGASLKGILSKAALVAGAVAGIGAAAKIAFDFGKEGAQLEYAAGKFDRLTASIGSTSDALLVDLRKATKGTLSDAQLMAGAGDLMALGLANSYDEVVRLSKVVGGLGMDMNQLVLTLTNQTTMRFDALGVSVDGFDAKVKALKDSGMDANAAFKEAFLQQAEAQLAKIGDKADTGAGSIMRMEASFANLADTLKMKVAPAAVAFADIMTDMLTNGQASRDVIIEQANSVDLLGGSYDDYLKVLQEVGRAQGYTVKEVNGQLRMFNSSGMDVTYMLQGFSRSAYEADGHLSRLAGQYGNTAVVVDEATGSFSENAAALAITAQKISDARAAAAHAAERWGEWNSRILGSISAMETLNTMQPNFGSTIQAELDKIEWEKLGGDAVQLAFGQIQSAAQDGIISKSDAEAALGELNVAAIGIQGDMDDLNVDELARRIQEATGGTLEAARAKAAEIQAALEAGTMKEYVYDITLRYNILNPPKTYVPPIVIPDDKPEHGPGKAAGGFVRGGVSYPVGERGVEMFTPSSNGYITPNNALGGGDTYNNIVINTLPGQDENAIAARVMAMLSRGNSRARAGFGYAGV